MLWPDIYQRLRRDPNDQAAWDMLDAGVRAWARPDLWNRGWTAVDDTVAEVCSEAVLSLDKARGGETFAGFVRGIYLNVRRRTLVAARANIASLDGVDPPAAPDEPFDDTSWNVLDECLSALPAREREAVRLRYFQQAATERIAATLDVTPVNARRIVFNGLAKLRRCAKEALSRVA
jgi:RNA polymerase sigma factor (sigma-70 family)